MELSRRSQQKFADLCAAQGTVRSIEAVYASHEFLLPRDFEPPETGQRRAVCARAEDGISVGDEHTQQRLLRVYLDGIEDFGRRPPGFFVPRDQPDDPLCPEARALVRALQRDGAPVGDDGQLVLGATAPTLAIDRFDRLGEPRALLEHIGRIEAGITADPAAAIGSAKELVESVCKFVLDDYGVSYNRGASLPDLYRLVADELRLTREAVLANPKASQAAAKVVQNLMTAVQSLAEMRNEIGLGHGRTTPSPALGRHARLAANSARAVAEFVLETWHWRREQESQ